MLSERTQLLASALRAQGSQKPSGSGALRGRATRPPALRACRLAAVAYRPEFAQASPSRDIQILFFYYIVVCPSNRNLFFFFRNNIAMICCLYFAQCRVLSNAMFSAYSIHKPHKSWVLT